MSVALFHSLNLTNRIRAQRESFSLIPPAFVITLGPYILYESQATAIDVPPTMTRNTQRSDLSSPLRASHYTAAPS